MLNPIITSLLDTDLYKLTMMQCVFHHFPQTQVAYRFQRRKSINLADCLDNIKAQIIHLCELRFSEEDLAYLQTLPFFRSDFLDFLRNFHLKKQYINISVKDNLEIRIEGPWLETILFEVPVLAIVNETYYQQHFPQFDLTTGRERLAKKIALLHPIEDFQFSDFGTRRRFSKVWQQEVIATCTKALPKQFIGTSNVYFAKLFHLQPIGTMAHEFLQACQVLAPHLVGSQRFALETWLTEFHDNLGIALTDVLTMDVFLQEFEKDLAARYIGLRQDSGDPIEWGEKALKHYQNFNIDARSKTFVFSNGLTIPKAIPIYNHFKDKVKMTFGIGTNLTNDVGPTPLDIVIKMTHTNQHPVIKISDSPGKIVCEDEHYLQYVKQLFHLRN